MIIGIATLFMFLFLGGGSLEFYLTNLKDAVKEHVHEEARQEVILDVSKKLGKELEDIQKDVEKQFGAYVELHSDYSSTPAGFDSITERMVTSQRALSKQVLDAREKMHAQMTSKEWSSVFKAD